ncbi:uncharacterized protein BDR25DRAFT_258324 [Lindgomyces ingoldianus]|uniref:Uncharacterized protein n=1 Tax=Lindgomyces ingoldianus TaxID=673940 RepID=A0ACB6R2X0_9PLEO|nr:uncharacterized protein BDR25DRAFT_258324 [Lindgomyces ingoldianus]KAF2472857.1 hypothetical protein BDR25DRAFT_258324 [Lindgomyces ingoldianus]
MSAGQNDAFETAFQNFFNSLPEKEKRRYSPCSSADDLLQSIHKLSVLGKKWQKTRVNRAVNRVKAFSDRLQPFFACISIFIQSNPTYSAIVWGSVRLVLQLASNFSSFFEKLLGILQRISESFPQYQEINAFCRRDSSQRLKRHVEHVYGDLLNFFQHIAKIFSTGSGDMRKRPAVVWNLVWTPVDILFKDLLQQFNQHAQFIRDELALFRTKQSVLTEDAAEVERSFAAEERRLAEDSRRNIREVGKDTQEFIQDRVFKDVHKWISPPDYADILESSLEDRSDGTCGWIFSNSTFESWQERENSKKSSVDPRDLGPRALWIHGNPGAGKTTLVSSIVQEMRATADLPGSEATVCYHFFSCDVLKLSESQPTAAYRSILSQILHQHRHNTNILDKYAFSLTNTTTGQLRASSTELKELLQLILPDLGPTYLFLDGIDECSDRIGLLNTVRILLEYLNVKILLSSRLNVTNLSRAIKPAQRIAIDRAAVSGDIYKYLCESLDGMIEEGYLPTADSSEIAGQLTKGANGMFIWAKLMVKLLNSPVLTPLRRLSVIQEVTYPEGLDQMYDRILNLIENSGELQRNVANKIMSWITYAVAPLSVQQLHEYIYMDQGGDHEDEQLEIGSFIDVLNSVCGSLTETYTIEPYNFPPGLTTNGNRSLGVRFIHLSVKEHLQKTGNNPKASAWVKSLHGKGIGHSTLAQECLKHVLHTTQQQDMRRGTLIQYAVVHWVTHLVLLSGEVLASELVMGSDNSRMIEEPLATLEKFLDHPIVVTKWLAAYFGTVATWLRNVRHEPDRFPRFAEFVNNFGEFARNLEKIFEQWGARLRLEQDLIWNEVVAFSGSRFLQSKAELTKVTYLQPDLPIDCAQSSRPLCTVSAISSDGLLNCALHVWPSKAYEERWQSLKANESLIAVMDVCDNWVAVYEVWSVDSKKRLATLHIPLETQEIWMQMRQSLHEFDQGKWTTAFPTAISYDLRSIVILRTLFVLDYSNARSTPIVKKAAFDPRDHAIHGVAFLHRARYVYSIGFSPDGRFLSFRDSIDLYDTLVVFEICRDEPLEIRTLNVFRLNKLSMMSNMAAFHPTDQILAFATVEGVELWNFGKGQVQHSSSRLNSLPLHKAGFSSLDSLEISSCGKYVVLSDKGQRPTVLDIPDSVFTNECQPDVYGNLGHGETPESKSYDLTKIANSEISNFGLVAGQVISSASVIDAKDGSGQVVMDVAKGEKVSIRLLTGEKGETSQALKVVSLPQSYGQPHTKPTILMPKSPNGAVRIVLNSTPHIQYSMDSTDAYSLPVIAERDQRLVQHSFQPQHYAKGQISSSNSLNQASLLIAAHTRPKMDADIEGQKRNAMDLAPICRKRARKECFRGD